MSAAAAGAPETGVFCDNCEIAILVLRWIRGLGRNPGQRLAGLRPAGEVAGHGGSMCRLAEPRTRRASGEVPSHNATRRIEHHVERAALSACSAQFAGQLIELGGERGLPCRGREAEDLVQAKEVEAGIAGALGAGGVFIGADRNNLLDGQRDATRSQPVYNGACKAV